MTLSIRNIIPIIKANWFGNNDISIIDTISIDSRSLQNGENTLFFAISGPNNDGHSYIEELIGKGVKHFVVTHIPSTVAEKANFLVVENTLEALQKFASYYRSLFDFPIIGITGSNGKTIIKEWLNFLLSPDYNIIRSPKSYNSQVGVPLSILGINEKPVSIEEIEKFVRCRRTFASHYIGGCAVCKEMRQVLSKWHHTIGIRSKRTP